MIDITTIEVIKGGLIYTAEEMGIALKKSAYSPNIKERMDHSCAIFNHRRELVAQAEHIPVHLGSMALAVKLGIDEYSGTFEQGDMILLNDPYISGTHLPDLTLIAPVFYENEIIGYVANKAHHTDIGGMAPGSLAASSKELYQEGMIIPPIKFVKKGAIDPEISQLIRSNVRTPKIQLGDLRAQIAANNTGINRIHELVETYNVITVHKAMDRIMDFSEQRIRNEIRKMPDGVYRAVDYMESYNAEGNNIEINVLIKKQKDMLFFDYSGTNPQVEYPVNAPLGVTIAGIYFTLISITDPTIPINNGCFRPILLNIPKGTIMNPYRPAPVAGGNVETSQRNVDVLMKVFSQITPEKVPAASQGTMNNITIGGLKKNGEPWTFYETIGGGSGARPNKDGVDGIHVNMTNTMNTPIETLEKYLPLKFLSYIFRKDSGGAGKYRGGCGIERSWTLTSENATLSIMAERSKINPWGLEGGHGGAKGEYIIVKPDGATKKLSSKCTFQITQGDTFIIRTPGGGGYGDPKERSPEKIKEDIINGIISLTQAREIYQYI